MDTLRDMFDWIDAQAPRMARLVLDLADINSGTANLAGLRRVCERLEHEFASLDAPVERIALPPRTEIDARGDVVHSPLGDALRFRRSDHARPGSPRVFLCIHYDTVYGPDHAFQHCTTVDANTLRGPGVVDAKGGIVVMLTALQAIERSGWRDRIQWEVLLNPDEEIGSPGSTPLLREAARHNDVGLLFEPALEGGGFAAPRKGSGNFALVIHGRAAHAGRSFEQGRNAIHLLAEAIVQLNAVNHAKSNASGVTLNVGKIEGGGATNIVPDLAIARFNARVNTPDEQRFVEETLATLLAKLNAREGYRAELHGSFTSPPKPLDAPTLVLLETLRDCGRALDLDLAWQSTGGVCDGNKLAAAGLPNVDTLGPRGGSIHSDQEYLLLDSLAERVKLTALFLARLCEQPGV